ncbi:MAG: SRPBCC family protein [Pseudomonadota bacterium]
MTDYAEVTGSDSVRFERLLPGPIERVWEHLVDGEKRARWLCGGATDDRAGGRIVMEFANSKLSDQPDDPPPEKHKDAPQEVAFEGRITDFDPPRCFAHTWEYDGEHSHVRYELSESGDQVLLVLIHTRLQSPEEVLGVCGGWHAHLDLLDDVLAGRPPRPFWRTYTAYDLEYEQRLTQ